MKTSDLINWWAYTCALCFFFPFLDVLQLKITKSTLLPAEKVLDSICW